LDKPWSSIRISCFWRGDVLGGGLIFGDQEAAQGGDDLRWRVRFLDEGIGAGVQTTLFKLAGAGAGHHRQWHVGELGFEHLYAGHAQGVGQLQVETEKLGRAILFHGRLDHVEFVDRDDFETGFDPVHEHGQRIAHQGMIVDDINCHDFFSSLN
jgi:hypothetical protein